MEQETRSVVWRRSRAGERLAPAPWSGAAPRPAPPVEARWPGLHDQPLVAVLRAAWEAGYAEGRRARER